MTAKLTADANGLANGLYVIAATPFHDDGRIDVESIDSLVDFYLACGVQGMTILGVMGEFQKLSESETLDVSQRFLKRTAGRVPIIVGVSNPGTNQLVKTARAVMEMGAAGVMAMPIRGLTTEPSVENYLRSILTALGPSIPVCIQDYPKLTDVYFSADCFLRLVDDFPQIAMFKHEDMPGLAKLSAIRRACDGKARRYIPILCGNGGIHLPQEYLRGADGAMTGFAFPDTMVQMHALFAAGKPEEGEDLYDLYLPLMRHELQQGVGLPLRKEILKRRGAIRSAAIRAPGPKLDATDMTELDRLLTRLAKKTGQPIEAIRKG